MSVCSGEATGGEGGGGDADEVEGLKYARGSRHNAAVVVSIFSHAADAAANSAAAAAAAAAAAVLICTLGSTPPIAATNVLQ